MKSLPAFERLKKYGKMKSHIYCVAEEIHPITYSLKYYLNLILIEERNSSYYRSNKFVHRNIYFLLLLNLPYSSKSRKQGCGTRMFLEIHILVLCALEPVNDQLSV